MRIKPEYESVAKELLLEMVGMNRAGMVGTRLLQLLSKCGLSLTEIGGTMTQPEAVAWKFGYILGRFAEANKYDDKKTFDSPPVGLSDGNMELHRLMEFYGDLGGIPYQKLYASAKLLGFHRDGSLGRATGQALIEYLRSV